MNPESRSFSHLSPKCISTSNGAHGGDAVSRVYDTVKHQVICCTFKPGERLNIETIADELEVSATPVRETLNRLVAEDLLELVPRIGFFMRPVIEGAVRELYELNFSLLNWAADLAEAEAGKVNRVASGDVPLYLSSENSPSKLSPEAVAQATGSMFCNLAVQAGNQELLARISSINDRLFYVRQIDAMCSEQAEHRVSRLQNAIRQKKYAQVKAHLVEYHNECLLVLRNVIKTLRMTEPKRLQSAPV